MTISRLQAAIDKVAEHIDNDPDGVLRVLALLDVDDEIADAIIELVDACTGEE